MKRIAVASKPKLSCPTCKKETQKEGNAHFPFCSDRCRLVDLGKWLDDGYSVPGSDSSPSADNEMQEEF